jgi:hypothetical protein
MGREREMERRKLGAWCRRRYMRSTRSGGM